MPWHLELSGLKSLRAHRKKVGFLKRALKGAGRKEGSGRPRRGPSRTCEIELCEQKRVIEKGESNPREGAIAPVFGGGITTRRREGQGLIREDRGQKAINLHHEWGPCEVGRHEKRSITLELSYSEILSPSSTFCIGEKGRVDVGKVNKRSPEGWGR